MIAFHCVVAVCSNGQVVTNKPEKASKDITMKSTRRFVFALFLLALPVASFAAKNSKEITFDKTTKVGNTELQPGTYRVAWSGTGPQVEVDFSHNRKSVASTTAKLVNASSQYDSAIRVRSEGSDSAVLEELDFKHLQLVFSQLDQPTGN